MFVKSRGKIDYEKLTRDFGSTKISAELLERMRKLTVGSGALGCPGVLGVFDRRMYRNHADFRVIHDDIYGVVLVFWCVSGSFFSTLWFQDWGDSCLIVMIMMLLMLILME